MRTVAAQKAYIRPKTWIITMIDRSGSTDDPNVAPENSTYYNNLLGAMMEALHSVLTEVRTNTQDLETELHLHLAAYNDNLVVVAADEHLATCDIRAVIGRTPEAAGLTEYSAPLLHVERLLTSGIIAQDDAVLLVLLSDDSGCNSGEGEPVARRIAASRPDINFQAFAIGNGSFERLRNLTTAFGPLGSFHQVGSGATANGAGVFSAASVSNVLMSNMSPRATGMAQTFAGSYQLHTKSSLPSSPVKKTFAKEADNANDSAGLQVGIPVSVMRCVIPDGTWEVMSDINNAKFKTSSVTLDKREKPFANGGMHLAYRGWINEKGAKRDVVLKESIFTNPELNTEGYIKNLVFTQALASKTAELYNAATTGKKVFFTEIMMLYNPLDRKWYAADQYLRGRFERHSSNDGGVNTQAYRRSPHAFSHFSHRLSRGTAVITDIQGVGEMYTDPVINSSDQKHRAAKTFGIGNGGDVFIKKFVDSHICNSYCKQLKLTEFSNGRSQSAPQSAAASSVIRSMLSTQNGSRRASNGKLSTIASSGVLVS
jgi:hypothetical protein